MRVTTSWSFPQVFPNRAAHWAQITQVRPWRCQPELTANPPSLLGNCPLAGSWPACQPMPRRAAATMAQTRGGALRNGARKPSYGFQRWSPGHDNRPLPCGQCESDSCVGPQTAGNGGDCPPAGEGSVRSGAGRWKAGVTTETTPVNRLRTDPNTLWRGGECSRAGGIPRSNGIYPAFRASARCLTKSMSDASSPPGRCTAPA